jgi:hypothetical protein
MSQHHRFPSTFMLKVYDGSVHTVKTQGMSILHPLSACTPCMAGFKIFLISFIARADEPRSIYESHVPWLHFRNKILNVSLENLHCTCGEDIIVLYCLHDCVLQKVIQIGWDVLVIMNCREIFFLLICNYENYFFSIVAVTGIW